MVRRKFSLMLFLFSLIGGAIGFAGGELLLARFGSEWPNVWLMALYFGVLGLATVFFCLLAETVSPEIAGQGWRLRHSGTGWKLLVPAAFIILFSAGAIFQFLYGFGLGKQEPAQDIVLVIDKSESMLQTDPKRESVEAAQKLIRRMDSHKQVAVILFNEQPELLQPLSPLRDAADRDAVADRLDSYRAAGQTDIAKALDLAVEQLDSRTNPRKSMVILISDGYSDVNLANATGPYSAKGIAIHTVGMNNTNTDATKLLKELAERTGGSYHGIGSAGELSGVFTKIYDLNRGWHLMGERSENGGDSLYYRFLRVLLFAGIGAFMGLALGIVFDNRHLAKSFTLGGAIAGILAGTVVEFWMGMGIAPGFGRFLADLILAAVLALSPLLIPVKTSGSLGSAASMNRPGRGPADDYGRASSGSFDRR
ncbi:vWA domain-containing protein [Gorillibacterium timonense]|uniref:vWA domain-containing protein n=1 Tax=Gorillibacterium timonense TaxID=1689269 RepID=UPI00071E28DF|nr:vWA domain-containing protein [Gorillibacterium timonense]